MTIGTIASAIAVLALFCLAGAYSFGIAGAIVGPLVGIAVFVGGAWAMDRLGASSTPDHGWKVEDVRFRSPAAPPDEQQRGRR